MAFNNQQVRLLFGLKLKQLRHDKGIQLTELAEKAGLSASYLNEIERGKKYPKSDKIFSLATALETDYDTLVSLRVSKKLEPIAELLNSNVLQELPLELFGIEPADLLVLLSDAPVKVSSFINTLIKISRSYGMNVEAFYFSALRSYQEMHNSYFGDIEESAALFISNNIQLNGLHPDEKMLRTLLEKQFNYEIEIFTEPDYPQLAGLRSVLIPGKHPRLLVSKDLEPEQLAFTFGREIGYLAMGLQTRPLISSVEEAESFEEVLNNFKASYFSGAILIPKPALIAGLEDFFSKSTWEPRVLIRLMHTFHATPEVFFHRICHVMTSHFGINELFFIRYDNRPGENTFRLSKELHLSVTNNLQGAINEHYCRRWISVTILNRLAQLQQEGIWNGEPLCEWQLVEYMDTGNRFLLLTMAKSSPPKDLNSSVTLGFTVDDKLLKLIRFLGNEGVEVRLVNDTCERCGAINCLERAHPPVIRNRILRNKQLKETLQQMQAGVKKV
jgi:transcriptional regulator with XRE-family HTH domain